jgi:hypothetical protein
MTQAAQPRVIAHIVYRTTAEMSYIQPVWTVNSEWGALQPTVWLYSRDSAIDAAETHAIYTSDTYIVLKHDKGVTTEEARINIHTMYPEKPRY